MQFLAGIVVLFTGIIIVSGCIRSYRRNISLELISDFMDYAAGNVLWIVAGVVCSLIGAVMTLYAFGISIFFSDTFPYIFFRRIGFGA